MNNLVKFLPNIILGAVLIVLFFLVGLLIEKIVQISFICTPILEFLFSSRENLIGFLSAFFTACGILYTVTQNLVAKILLKENIISGLIVEIFQNYENSGFDGLEIGFSSKFYDEFIVHQDLFKINQKDIVSLMILYKHLKYYNNLLEYKSRGDRIDNHYLLLTEKQYLVKLEILYFADCIKLADKNFFLTQIDKTNQADIREKNRCLECANICIAVKKRIEEMVK